MIRLITSLVQLALFIPAMVGLSYIVSDIRNGGLND
jgi:hypothetical protein